MAKILIHGSGHKAASWNETISHMETAMIYCVQI